MTKETKPNKKTNTKVDIKEFIKKNKKPLLIALIVVLIAIIATVIYFGLTGKKEVAKKEKKDETYAITTEGIIKEETLNGLKFNNVVLIKKDGMFTLTMDVTNPSKEEIDLEQVNIELKNKADQSIITLLGYIGEPMKAGEVRTVTASTSADLSTVTTKNITVKEVNKE